MCIAVTTRAHEALKVAKECAIVQYDVSYLDMHGVRNKLLIGAAKSHTCSVAAGRPALLTPLVVHASFILITS